MLLVDCGYSVRELERRLQARGRSAQDITAILVTHEHGDHVRGVGPLSRRYQLPVWITRGTALSVKDDRFHATCLITAFTPFSLGNIDVTPFPVPHDAREPCQFLFEVNHQRLGLLTDVGSITGHMLQVLGQCDALMLEFNYDPAMLASGPYPLSLQRRINNDWGHLSNAQACLLLQQLDTRRLTRLVGMHMSEKNNHADLAMAAMRAGLPHQDCDLTLADQAQGFDWMDF